MTKLSQESVESALGGGALVATIEEGHEVIADLSDLVAVKADDSDALVVVNCCVCFGELLTVLDSGVHFGFDLAGHELSELRLVGVVSSPDVHSIDDRGGESMKLVPVPQAAYS